MKARPVKKLDPANTLGENAARIVNVRLGEMLSFAPAALERDQELAQHDMRIAAKRLRYVLELTAFTFGRAGDAARRRSRDLQDILGEMHDCDVMLPRVLGHLADLRAEDARVVREKGGSMPDLDPRLAAQAPHRTSYRGLEVLAVYLTARRELLFDRFVAFWEAETGTWVRLQRAADRRLEQAREARRAEKAAELARLDAEAHKRAAAEAQAEAARALTERDRAQREAAEHSQRATELRSD